MEERPGQERPEIGRHKGERLWPLLPLVPSRTRGLERVQEALRQGKCPDDSGVAPQSVSSAMSPLFSTRTKSNSLGCPIHTPKLSLPSLGPKLGSGLIRIILGPVTTRAQTTLHQAGLSLTMVGGVCDSPVPGTVECGHRHVVICVPEGHLTKWGRETSWARATHRHTQT